jgi:hypothetical protein
VLTGALILVGCGDSSQVSSSFGSYIGHASNAAVFIQWTRSGDSLSGSLQEAMAKEGEGGGVESSSRAFTGTINGKGLTLTLHEALDSTSALVGRLSARGFTDLFDGGGERHQGADEAESSTDVDGWGCGTGAGGWGCRRAGEYISALTPEPKG